MYQNDTQALPTTRPVFAPRADILESTGAFLVNLEIPGADEKTIQITLEKRRLMVEARVEESIPDGFEPIRLEYRVGDYVRSFLIPEEVDAEAIKAQYKNGVLRIELAKSKAAQPRRIEVKAA